MSFYKLITLHIDTRIKADTTHIYEQFHYVYLDCKSMFKK